MALKKIIVCFTTMLIMFYANAAGKSIKIWDCMELQFKHTIVDKNPFTDICFSATFKNVASKKQMTVNGFYDGNDTFVIRFMPTEKGEWEYITSSSEKALDHKSGTFICTDDGKQRSMVTTGNDNDFIFADSTHFHPLGTTSYAWTFAEGEKQKETFVSLKQTGFNKIRFCIFPNESVTDEPKSFPFVYKSVDTHKDGKYKGYNNYEWDLSRFNTTFFKHLEECIKSLDSLGIEADIILFHPYDMGRWGFDSMTMEQNKFYLKYVEARLGAYRNVWWSLANEWNLVKSRTESEWIELTKFVRDNDPYGHLCSIHGGTAKYINYTLPCFTHVSIQDQGPLATFEGPATLRNIYHKPVIFDEVCYEGDHESRWAQLTGEEMLERIWTGLVGGAYVTHGECFCTQPEFYTGHSFLATGGKFKGTCPQRIKFTLSILKAMPSPLRLADPSWDINTASCGNGIYIRYFGKETPYEWHFELPIRNGRFGKLKEGTKFKVEIIDTWNMTITEYPTIFTTKKLNKYRLTDKDSQSVKLPSKPYQMLRITAL